MPFIQEVSNPHPDVALVIFTILLPSISIGPTGRSVADNHAYIKLVMTWIEDTNVGRKQAHI